MHVLVQHSIDTYYQLVGSCEQSFPISSFHYCFDSHYSLDLSTFGDSMTGPPEGVFRPDRAFSLVEEGSMVFCLRGVCDDDWELDGPVVPA